MRPLSSKDVTNVPRKPAQPEAVELHCLFCGGRASFGMRSRHSNELVCPGCHAAFLVERDVEGCVTGLQIAQCGTPFCCRLAEGRASSTNRQRSTPISKKSR